MNYCKKGCTDTVLVRRIQSYLKVTENGFGPKTEMAVAKFQRDNNLVVDGIVGPKTMAIMGILDSSLEGQLGYPAMKDLFIAKHFMPAKEYLTDTVEINYEYIFLHHTAGWNNPFNVIDAWARDNRGTVGTEFVIGGKHCVSGDDKYDGQIVQAFPTGSYAWHLGLGNTYMHKHSVGIELCNFGPLNDVKKTYVGTAVAEDQVNILEEPFRGIKFWHKYSDAQIKNLKLLLEYLAARDNVNLKEGLVRWIKEEGPTKAFGYHQEAAEGKVKGLLTHVNVYKYNYDVAPQTELVDMLLDL